MNARTPPKDYRAYGDYGRRYFVGEDLRCFPVRRRPSLRRWWLLVGVILIAIVWRSA